MNTTDEKRIRQAVAHAAETGQLAGLMVEFWRGGGLPPPLYRSEQLRLLTQDGADTAVFANLVFDERFNPPDVHEKWTVRVTADDIHEVARLLKETSVLEDAYAGQPAPAVADGTTTELIVSLGEPQILRKFGPKLPEHLAKLEEVFQRLIATAKEKSPKVLYHEGKKVS